MAGLLYTILFIFGVCFQRCFCAQCKITPDSPEWPTDSQWQALNASVSGNLIKPIPPGAVCHQDWAEYDNASCSALSSQWTDASFHHGTPATVDYNDDACLPSSSTPCSSSGYPAYVVDAASAADVQAAVQFAAKTGVRLIVKATGHDFLGRSSGAGALSIWTHNFRDIDFDMNDARIFNGAVGTVKIGAGMQVADILSAASDQNLTVVTGSDPTVGIVGFLAAGGHGPVTSRFGLGADQVVEMEVVAPDGESLTINQESQPDLFWAIRGGGGSTFAVVISVTVLAYPNLPMTLLSTAYSTTAESDTFWNLATLFHTWIPRLSEAGVMGYYYILSNSTGLGLVTGDLLVPEKSVAEAQAILAPMEAQIRASNWTDKVSISDTGTSYPSYSSFWAMNSPAAVGFDARLGSRLLDKEALTANTTQLKAALQNANPPTRQLLGHMVAGPGPRNIKVPGGNAVLPAWRSTYSHVLIPVGWDPLDAAEEASQTSELKGFTQALKQLAPNTGAYVSESDPTEVDWQQTFWGDNYPRLLSIREKWDSAGVFWCVPCVGHELWTVSGGDAIGQDNGTICRS